MPNISVIAVFKNGSRLFAAPWINGRFQEGPLPLLAKGPYFQLERPGAAWLLIELPVGFRNRRRRHQEIGVIEGTRPQRLQPPLTHPFGVDAGVDDEMGNVDVLRAKLARGRLGDGPQAKFGTGEGRIAGSAAQARGRTGEEDIALSETLRNTRSVVSRIGKLTLAPTLKMQTSSGACPSASPRKAMISSSLRASSERAWISPPAASISFTSGSSLAPLRRPANTVNPSEANFLAISPPM